MAYSEIPECLANNGDDHCCWIRGKVCPHLQENTIEGRRWVCGLFVREQADGDTKRETWDRVAATPEWIADVKDLFDCLGLATCGDFPGPGHICLVCGAVGNKVDQG